MVCLPSFYESNRVINRSRTVYEQFTAERGPVPSGRCPLRAGESPDPPPENTRGEAGIVQETLSDLRKSPGVGMMLPIVREVS